MTILDLSRRIPKQWERLNPYDQSMLVQRLVEVGICTRMEAALLFGLSHAQIAAATDERAHGQDDVATVAMRIGLSFAQSNDERLRLAVQYAMELA